MRRCGSWVGIAILVAGIAACTSTPDEVVPQQSTKPGDGSVVASSSPVAPDLVAAGVRAVRSVSIGRDERILSAVVAGDIAVYGATAPGAAEEDAPNWLSVEALFTKSITRVGPVRPGWAIESSVVEGREAVWVESRRMPDGSCGDASFGCYQWSMYGLDLTGLLHGTLIAEQTRSVPRRAIPLEPTLSGGVLCWAAAPDGGRYAISTTELGTGRTTAVGSNPHWITRCEAHDASAYATEWSLESGTGTLLDFRPGRARKTVVESADTFAVAGGVLAYVTAVDGGEGGRSILLEDRGGAAREVGTYADVKSIGFIDAGTLWTATTSGLDLVDVATGRATASLAQGDGPLVVTSDGHSLTWTTDPGSGSYQVADFS